MDTAVDCWPSQLTFAAGSELWLEYRIDLQQEFVIGGYRPGPHSVDALLVGYHVDGDLRFAAKVRAGFTPHVRREVLQRLQQLGTKQCPFFDLPTGNTTHWGGGVTPEEMKQMQWLKPAAVAHIRFAEWTADGRLRHSAFSGLREDKAANDVRRET
ncbi:MAG: hypothetical protein GEV06_24485 [Luteitalea sp.]|nr:hypothetical protein [Luteitalea sp.]